MEQVEEVVRAERTIPDLQSQWSRLGGGFTVAPSVARVGLEKLIIDSASSAHAESRLLWIMISWLSTHGIFVDRRQMSRELIGLVGERTNRAQSALASATCGAAFAILEHWGGPMVATWRALQAYCRRLELPCVLFDAIASNRALAGIVQRESLPQFSEWGLWHNEIIDSRDAIRSTSGVLRGAPELRIRAVLGADLAAAIVEHLSAEPLTVSDLARRTGATRAAVHEAAAALASRGLVIKPTVGYRRALSLRPGVLDWFESFPAVSAA